MCLNDWLTWKTFYFLQEQLQLQWDGGGDGPGLERRERCEGEDFLSYKVEKYVSWKVSQQKTEMLDKV